MPIMGLWVLLYGILGGGMLICGVNLAGALAWGADDAMVVLMWSTLTAAFLGLLVSTVGGGLLLSKRGGKTVSIVGIEMVLIGASVFVIVTCYLLVPESVWIGVGFALGIAVLFVLPGVLILRKARPFSPYLFLWLTIPLLLAVFFYLING